MPLYRIKGAHRETALEQTITIKAPNEQAAADAATCHGFLVSEIRPADMLAEIAESVRDEHPLFHDPEADRGMRNHYSAVVPTARPSQKSDAVAFFLGILLGPVGLWYKGCWAAGFAWLAVGLIFAVITGFYAAPLLWLAVAMHAAIAQPR